jgi:hypothetical protein
MRRSGHLILSPYGPRWVEVDSKTEVGKASPAARQLPRP